MVIFGRRPSKGIAIPSNRGMADRANRQLEGYAHVKAEQFETALGVDAPFFYFWHNSDGSIPCTCVAAKRGPNRDIDVGGETKFITDDRSQQLPDFEIIKPEYGDSSLKGLFGNPLSLSKRPATLESKIEIDDEDDPLVTYDDADDDIQEIEAVFEDDQTASFDDPLNLFGGKIIDCPICLGTGYIDAWNVHGGKRFVFDTTNAYEFYCEGINVNDNANPNIMIAEDASNAKVFWQFKLPLVWDRILRINVYNGIEIIPAYKYRWVLKDSNAIVQEVTPKNLEALNNSGSNLQLSLTLKELGLQITHAEIVFAFSEPRRAQIPEIQQGYEQEFLDWNVNLSVELPPDLQISEGDYLTESKYKRVWKVSTLTRKSTAGGVTYGLSADLRALHSFEKDAVQLSLFQTNYLTGNLVK